MDYPLLDAAPQRHINYLGVLRIADQAIVASYAHQNIVGAEMVHEIMGTAFIEPNKRYAVDGEFCTFQFTADEMSRVFLVVTDRTYPNRCAFMMLDELKRKFVPKYGDKALNCREGQLDKKCERMFRELCTRYDDVGEIDKIAAVNAKVDVVKSVMQDNVKTILANTEKIDNIKDTAEELNRSAEVFKGRATTLKRNMCCKNAKYTAILVLIILGALAAVVVPLALKLKAGS